MLMDRNAPTTPETGSALIMVLIFLLAVGPVLVALVSLSGSNLLNTSNLRVQRNREFAGDTAVEGAIEAMRYSSPCTGPCSAPPPPPACPTFPSRTAGLTVDGITLMVDCWAQPPSFGRNVEFDACTVAAAASFPTCQSKAVVRAQVLFNDVSSAPGCTVTTPGCYGNSWGTSMVIESWTVLTADG